MIAPAVIALAVLAAQGSGAPPDDAGAEAAKDAETRVPDLRDEGRPSPRAGARHALALGWHATSFSSDRGSHYTFHSLSIGWLASYGSRGPFVHATALFPLQARQDGRVYATGDYYNPRSGGDLLVGWQWRWEVHGAEVETGPGLHGSLLWLPGREGYRDFSAFPIGLGLASTARWRLGTQVFSRALILGAYGSLAYDLYDPLHSEDLSHAITSRLGLLLGLEAAP